LLDAKNRLRELLMKAVVMVGTRAELIKLFPLIKQVEERGHELVFVHTGQHDIEELCEIFNVRKPDKVLSKIPEQSSKFNGSIFKAIKWNLMLIKDIRSVLSDESPDYVVYHGDTMSTALAAFSSSRVLFPFRKFKTAHVEAGLRSGSAFEPFPEEISRIFADATSNMLFAVSSIAENNLKHHKTLGKLVYNAGNTIIDSTKEAEKIGEEYAKEEYGIVTIHRHENIQSQKRMKKIIEILEESPRNLIFPLHDNTKAELEKYGLMDRIAQNDKIEIVDLVDYPEFINMIKGADILYTDGGSIQEESLIYNVPCIILRERTERKEGVREGINYLSKFEVSETIEKASELVKKDFQQASNPYGDPGVAERVVEKLEENL